MNAYSEGVHAHAQPCVPEDPLPECDHYSYQAHEYEEGYSYVPVAKHDHAHGCKERDADGHEELVG